MTTSSEPASLLIEDGLTTQLPAGLSPWRLAPPGSVAFSATGDRGAEPRWMVASGTGRASRSLARAERTLDGITGALPVVERRLVALSDPASFASGVPQDVPESLLRSAMTGLPGTTSARLAYSITDRFSPTWERAHAAFRSALEHLERLVNGRSWVETSQDDRLLARTMLDRAGDHATVWRKGISGADSELHMRAVELAQRSALTFARSVGLAIRGATLLGSLVTGPAGFLLAIPAVWAFVDDVIATVDGMRS